MIIVDETDVVRCDITIEAKPKTDGDIHQCIICLKSRHHSNGINSEIVLEHYPDIAPRGLWIDTLGHRDHVAAV